jgi:ribonucleoside-diphosphate reductase beta chain
MRQFATNLPRRSEDSVVINLYHKGKRNFWDPQNIEFATDRADWQGLSAHEQTTLLHLSALFVAGEEAVALDLAPYLLHVSHQGRYDDALFVALWTLEEAKHAEFFDAFHRQVIGEADLGVFHGQSYRNIFHQALPEAMGALVSDPSPEAEVSALTTYNMIVEGILAETGYRAFREALERRGILRGLLSGLAHVQADEGRHIAYGLHRLKQLFTQHPNTRNLFEGIMNERLPDAVGIVQEVFAARAPVPFGLSEEAFIDYALRQLQHRVEALE